MKTVLTFFIVVSLCFVIASCGSQRRIDNTSNSTAISTINEGRIIFKMKCDKCHPNGEAGVGLPLNNINLPGFLTRYRIRSRSFLLYTGKMPAFCKDEISKAEMVQLISYIKHLHHSKSEKLMTGK